MKAVKKQYSQLIEHEREGAAAIKAAIELYVLYI